ncbi:MAG TPA: SDR family oxidoreductase [Candidatus Kapabacteria bacterium]|jgi:NAD(P)-dependent dehydrogenase (short-subunit alcohol dehydrogenase family)|nr:SDR family oxidoreductase [Candidatus Kapabacteria bacterium]
MIANDPNILSQIAFENGHKAIQDERHSDLFSLKGKVAIVTGALGLLGREHCIALSDAGADVIAADLDADACYDFARELMTKSKFPALGIGVDITDPVSLGRAYKKIMEECGHIDILVNNAAVNDKFEDPLLAGELSRFEQYPLEQWERSLRVNVTGTFLASQIFGAEMAKAGQGSIINVASTYGIVGPDQSLYTKPDGTQPFYKSPSYSTTKGAIIAFTRYLAAYWGKSGVRVNTLSPGGVENNQDEYFIQNYAKRTPLGRMAQPGDYRGALVFLASDASSYMTGANLVVDGGWTAW